MGLYVGVGICIGLLAFILIFGFCYYSSQKKKKKVDEVLRSEKVSTDKQTDIDYNVGSDRALAWFSLQNLLFYEIYIKLSSVIQ